MSRVDLQKYLTEADMNKERYRLELQAYKQTETYRKYLARKKKLKALSRELPQNGFCLWSGKPRL